MGHMLVVTQGGDGFGLVKRGALVCHTEPNHPWINANIIFLSFFSMTYLHIVQCERQLPVGHGQPLLTHGVQVLQGSGGKQVC